MNHPTVCIRYEKFNNRTIEASIGEQNVWQNK